MNLFDKEERIIELFQDLKRNEILIYPKSFKIFKVYRSIHSKRLWSRWINSSGKSELPPDYYNEKNKLMMDVMRIDDHAYVNDAGRVINPYNQRESQLIKELSEKNPLLKEAAIEGRLFIIPDSGLRGYEDHNYDFYVNNFKRVIEKHINKIHSYEKNHPNYETVFLVFDESTPYFENPDLNYKKFTKIGQCKKGRPHFWWLDKNMLKIIRNSNIDYLIWITPYKHFESVQRVELPKVIIYDVSKIPYDKLIEYDERKIESLEA